MMRTTSKLLKCLAVLSALLPFCMSGSASVVYDNSTTDLNYTYTATNGVEYGDEIYLAGADRVMNDFKFEYFLGATASGNEQAVLTVYRNNGPLITRTNPDSSQTQYASPGDIVFTSPVLNLQSGYQVGEISGLNVAVPDSFTWTVTFTGIDAGEVVGLRVYDPPTVGSSFADFWQKNGGSWNTYLINDPLTGNPIPANFAARVTAVPEPSTLVLGLLAGLSWLGFLGYKRRS